jgi:signal transduction histidine kinase
MSIAKLKVIIQPVTSHHTVGDIVDLFLDAEYQALLSIPVVDDKKLLGIISRYQLMQLYFAPYGRDLFSKKKVTSVMNPCPLVVDSSLSVAEASNFISANIDFPIREDFIITTQDEYLGMGIVLDLLRATEKELGKAYQHLRASQSQLVQSEKMSGLGQLVAGVAHEINNPVNFVHLGTYKIKEVLHQQKQFLVDLLQEEPTIVDKLNRQYKQLEASLGNVEEGCVRIKTIVDDLRTFSRLDEAERKSVNILESLQSTIRITQTQYQKKVDIVTDFKTQAKLECWPARLNQVFMNIIVNGCQAIGRRQAESETPITGTLSITGIEIERENGYKELAIRFLDNGCGMSEETKNKIFEPFFTTKPVGEGTGLGMSISYTIIQEHKGRIDIKSKLGQGTMITLYLPL